VSDDGKTPLAGVTVLVRSDEDGPEAVVAKRQIGAQGRFTLDLPQRDVSYVVSFVSSEGVVLGGHALVEGGDDLGAITIQRGGALWGKVTGPGEAPVAGVEVQARFRLKPKWLDEYVVAAKTRTDQGGAFRFEGLSAGRYHLRTAGGTYAPRQGRPVRVTLRPGTPTQRDVEVVRTGSLVLSLQSKEEGIEMPESVCISLSVSDGAWAGYDELTAPVHEGKATFGGLAAGAYELTVESEELGESGTQVTVQSDRQTAATVLLPRVLTFRGSVADEAGRPVVGAEVQVDVTGEDDTEFWWRETETDQQGQFRILGLMTGKAEIPISHDDFLPQQSELVLQSGAMPPRTFVLKKGLTLSGKVVDTSGRPAPGAEVAVSISYDDGNRELNRGARTDRNGRFRVSGLAAGEAEVLVRHEALMPESREIAFTQGGDCTFVLKPGLVIAGTIQEQDGTRPGDVDLLLTGPDGGQATTHLREDVPIREDGSFRFGGLEPRKYTLAFSGEALCADGSFCVPDVVAGTEDVMVVLGAKRMVEVRVIGTDGDPMPYADVRVTKDETGLLAGLFGASAIGDVDTTDRDGRLQIVLRQGEEYDVVASKPPLLQARQTVDLTAEAGPPGDKLRIQLSRGGTVDGVLVSRKDGRPMAGVQVAATRRGGPYGLLLPARGDDQGETETDERGRFRFEGLPFGVVTLCVLSSEGSLLWGEEILATRRVLVREGGGGPRLRISVAQPGGFKGRAVHPDGSAVPDCRLYVDSTSNLDIRYMPRTDRDGKFSLENLAPGPYVVTWTSRGADGRRSRVPLHPVKIEPGRTTELQLGGGRGGATPVRGVVKLDGTRLDSGSMALMPIATAALCPTSVMNLFAGLETCEIASSGKYSFGSLSPGRYHLRIVRKLPDGGAQVRYTRTLTIARSQRNLDIDIVSARLAGTVTLPDGKPVEGAAIAVAPSGMDLTRCRAFWNRTTSGREGAFCFPSAAVGTYDVHIEHEIHGRWARPGVVVGPESARLDIVLGQAAQISGRISCVTDGGVLGARVFAISQDYLVDSEGVVDADGTYELDQKVCPGRYRVFVLFDGHAVETAQLDVRKDMEFNAVLILGGDLHVTLAGSAKAIRHRFVRVEDEKGREVLRLRKPHLVTRQWLGPCFVRPTDVFGETMVYGLRPGRYRIDVEGSKAAARVTVEPLETTEVKLNVD